MALNSLYFWFLFPLIFIVYWGIPFKYNKARNIFLLLVSYLLYMCWNPAFALVLLGVSLITYFGALLFTGVCQHYSLFTIHYSLKKHWRLPDFSLFTFHFSLFTLLGLLPLLTVKYLNFQGNPVAIIGLSFFSLQAVGYLLDVYHKRIAAEKNLADYLLFVSFFPQVTAGPISTAAELIPQIKKSHTFDADMAISGMKMVIWGMFLKMAIADRIGIYVDTVYANYQHCSGSVCFLASLMYSIQIYCDFAGYSLMAIGIARTLGFKLIDNFRRPYLAASVTEFWRRWHISLTRWLTTHVYINLGGNRCSKARQYFNIMVTFLVSGLWHGANWTFLVWGALHGLLQIIEKVLWGERIKAEIKTSSTHQQSPVPCHSSHTGICPIFHFSLFTFHFSLLKSARIIVTFILVSIAWIFFRMPTLSDACTMIGRFFTDFAPFTVAPMDTLSLVCLAICLPLLFAYDIYHEYLKTSPLMGGLGGSIFYLFISILTLSIGVLDSGQFIYVSF